LPRTRFQEAWVDAAHEFGLHVHVPFQVSLDERSLEIPVLLEEFGAPRGMLLVEDWTTISSVADELVALGYGYSCIQHPLANQYDAASLADMLADWGWSGVRELPEPVARLLAVGKATSDLLT
jgi:hypothetical protein